MDETENGLVPFVEKLQQKRIIQRRCPICDRGHSCFATAADLDAQVMESSQEIAIGSVHRLQTDAVGSWHGVKTPIPDGTKLVVKNLHTEKSGALRAMVELENGDVQWLPARLLGNVVG